MSGRGGWYNNYEKKIKMNPKVAYLVFFISSLSWTAISAQEKSEIHVGVSLIPQLNQIIYERPDNTESQSQFGGRLDLDWYMDGNERWQFVTGLSFQYFYIEQRDYSLTFGCDYDPINGVDMNQSYIDDQISTAYIGVPFSTRFKLLGEENHWYLRLGGSYMRRMRVSKKSVLVECGTHETVLQNNPVNNVDNNLFVANLGTGYECKLSEKWKCFVEPTISYTLNSIYEEAGLVGDLTNNPYIWSYGLRLGVRN